MSMRPNHSIRVGIGHLNFSVDEKVMTFPTKSLRVELNLQTAVALQISSLLFLDRPKTSTFYLLMRIGHIRKKPISPRDGTGL